MTMDRAPLVAGNWKMNGTQTALPELDALVECLRARPPACSVMICPPHTLLSHAAARVDLKAMALGGQDCHAAAAGAHTGDVAAEMLADLGAAAVIVGHSERRHDHGEDDRQVREKAAAAHRAGLLAILCVGEDLAARQAGDHEDVVRAQLAASLPVGATPENTVIAYEPVWAIGTGRVAELSDVRAMHAALRPAWAQATGTDGEAVRILYGGSVKPDNAAEIASVDGVDGLLVGGASLKADAFDAILNAYRH